MSPDFPSTRARAQSCDRPRQDPKRVLHKLHAALGRNGGVELCRADRAREQRQRRDSCEFLAVLHMAVVAGEFFGSGSTACSKSEERDPYESTSNAEACCGHTTEQQATFKIFEQSERNRVKEWDFFCWLVLWACPLCTWARRWSTSLQIADRGGDCFRQMELQFYEARSLRISVLIRKILLLKFWFGHNYCLWAVLFIWFKFDYKAKLYCFMFKKRKRCHSHLVIPSCWLSRAEFIGVEASSFPVQRLRRLNSVPENTLDSLRFIFTQHQFALLNALYKLTMPYLIDF